jgi:TM2 domain-containing membrane protein YozV
MRRDRVTAALLCLFLGTIGLHFFYLGKYKLAFKRLGIFFLFWPYAFISALREAYKIAKMTDYEFNNTYFVEKVKGSGSRMGLHEHINNLHKK